MTQPGKGILPVKLSYVGSQMARMSGLRSLMEDIAVSSAAAPGAAGLNLSIGNPAAIPEVVAMWRELSGHTVTASFADAGQYGPSRGTPVLIQAIADYFRQHLGWAIGPENIAVGPGSQMLCFAAAALYGGDGPAGLRRVGLPMMPEYTGYQGMCLTPDGIAGIEAVWMAEGDRSFSYALDLDALARRDDLGMLLLSSPGNPTGRSVRQDEQDKLIAIASRLDIPLFLDHAYGQPFPQIGPVYAPPVLHPNVVNCFSLSKAGLPGERIGFAVGPERYITPMVSFLSNSVLHASRIAQATVAEGFRSGAIDHAVTTAIRPFYAARRSLAEKLLLDAMPANVDWRVHANEGGMFAWLWVNEEWFDDLTLYQDLKARGVFITPGRSFFTVPPRPAHHSSQCFRITLSVEEEILREGIKRIGLAVGQASRPPMGPS
jgi:valine--pyruvate aminotransferase